MKIFITGGAGFIGSNLVDRLLADGHEVVVYDNFSTGREEFIKDAKLHFFRFKYIYGDVSNMEQKKNLVKAMKECDIVFHMAANADVRHGLEHPCKDLQQNTIATFNVLEAMRENRIKKIVFPSTGSIYGEAEIVPTPENAPFPLQTSLYGASKLACEGLIEAYCEGYNMQSWIFRFVSVLGERYTHGHIYDFVKQLEEHPNKLYVLGNGTQTKSYMYVQDCIDAMLIAINKSNEKVNLFNLGTNDVIFVKESMNWICKRLNLNPEIEYSGGTRGWVGDNPFIYLNCNKIRTLGWKPKLSIYESVIKTVDYLKENKWVLDLKR